MFFNKWVLYTFILILTLAGCNRSSLLSWSREKDKKTYRVLVLHSSAAPNFMSSVQYLMERELKKTDLKLEISYVIHHTQDMSTEDSFEGLNKKLKSFNQNPPDIIITINDDALNFLLATRTPMTFDVPIVFSNVTFPIQILLDERTNVTGQVEVVDYRQAYELAKQLFGEIDEIQLIYGFQRLDGDHYDHAVENIRKFPELSFGRGWDEGHIGGPETLPVDTIRPPQTLSHPLQVNHDIVTLWPFDQFCRYYNRQDSRFPVRRIGIKAGEEFIYARFFSYYYLPCLNVNNAYFPSVQIEGMPLKSGCLGGYMNPIENQVSKAASTAIRILKGEPVSHFPVDTAPRVPIFDWNAMQYWHISEDKLPEGSRVVNKPFVLQYKNALIGATVFILGLLVGTVYLLVRYSKQTKFVGNTLFRKLKEEQDHMQTTVNSVNEAILSFDKKGLLTSINPTAIRLLEAGDSSAELLGQPIYALLQLSPPYGSDQFWLTELSEKACETDKKQLLPEGTILYLRNGKVLHIVGILRALFLNGESIGTLFTFQDCTDKLRQSRFLEFSMAAGDVYTWQINDTDERITFHQSFFIQNKIEHDDSGLMLEKFLQLIHPEDQQNWLDTFGELRQNRAGNKRNIELRLLTPSGYIWFEFRISSMPSADLHQASRFFGICLSIQLLKETETSMIQVLEEAKESNRLKSEFLANMSHEIRTPLNAIVGFSSIIEDVPPQERRQFMELISSNCDLLLQTVNDILDISRVESGFPFQYKVCRLNGLFSEVWKEQQELFKEGAVELFLNLPKEECLIETDPFRLKQVLVQLIKNAWQFTPAGSVVIGYKPTDDKERLCLYVSDTGIGISPENREIVFERFYKLNSFTAGGGLGLPLCKEIVARLHGEIKITDGSDNGTCVSVYLPIHQANPAN